MRLFKRQSSDASPQLVSATPISQDSAAPLPIVEKNPDKADKTSSQHDYDRTSRMPSKESDSDLQKPGTSQTCVSNRKGISTWGRKVGRRWDQLKRSDSSELLSVSGRRRRWSPNRKSGDAVEEKDNTSSGLSELPKPKRISRVESLRNLFRSSERSNNFLSSDTSSRNVTIQEEDVTCISHYPMEKALSEGAIKNVPFPVVTCDDSQVDRGTLLHEKRKQLSRSIQDLQEQQKVLDYILKNQEMLKTQEGTVFARETLNKVRTSVSPDRRTSQSSVDTSKNSVSTQTRDFFSTQLHNIKKNLFNVRTSSGECDRSDIARSNGAAGLEEVMNNLRLGCDESGYDSDSTRAGADSPDSGKSVPPMLKPRSFSITSDDYHGIDLSLPVSTPKKKDVATDTEEDIARPCLDDTVVLNKSLLNASIRTDSTVLASEGEETDSCDEETFEGFTEYEMSFANQRAAETNSLPQCSTGLSKMSLTGSAGDKNFGKRKVSSVRDPMSRATNTNSNWITEKKSLSKLDNNVPASQTSSRNLQKETSSQQTFLKSKRQMDSSALNLLENAASPCKDSPPATKICQMKSNSLQYYSPKRSRSSMELGASEIINARNKIKKSVQTTKVERPAHVVQQTPAKSLARRELKTMKLTVGKQGNLGISVERREAVRPYYVISKMDANGEASRSKQFRIGDEIVRVCGRRLRGMSIIEARSALKNCAGTVELQIAREPTFTFGEELGDTWGELLVRTRSDSEVWMLKEAKTEFPSSGNAAASTEQCESSSRCEIVGALMKDGKKLSLSAMDSMESEDCCELSMKKESDQKMTGMRKFYVVKKRSTNAVSCSRRATSLSMDVLTITLEKGAPKKMGFSIVGGSDSSKGSMGIFVKDVIAGGQAAEEGTLKVGDEILAINGSSMEGLTHAKALQTFKAAKAGKMILHIGRRDPTHKRYIIQSKSYDCLDKLTETGDEYV